MRKHLREGNVVPIASTTGERMEIGATDTPNGPRVYIKMGTDRVVFLTPDRAEEYAVDLRSFAIECRNQGGAA